MSSSEHTAQNPNCQLKARNLRPALLKLFVLWLSLTAPIQAAPKSSVFEYEAENERNFGSAIGPDRTFGTLAAEASGRRAVRLERPNQSIQMTLAAPSNALTIRYSLPLSRDNARLSSIALIKVGGRTIARVLLTSHYSFDNAYAPPHPATDRPVHHFWDEMRILLPKSLPVGTKIELCMGTTDANPFAVDLVDAELVPAPAAAPAGSISVLQFGADPSGQLSARDAFIRAVEAAHSLGRALYVPAGVFNVDGHIVVNDVTIVGAGSWYSHIEGHNLGFYSAATGSSRVLLSGFAIESDVAKREDRLPLAAIGGTFSSSIFQNLYLHHAKVGIWLDGPAHDLTIRNVDIADQAADGVNLHRGIRNAHVENNNIRNTGDDGIATWSDGVANDGIVIRGNRISTPGLANGIAIYGGRNIDVRNNYISDVLIEGGGIHLGTRFNAAPFSGKIRIRRNRIVRSATMDPNWHFGVGAIWIYALEKPIDADISISNNEVDDPGCEAVQLIGPNRIENLRIDHLKVTGRATSLFALQTGGSMYATGIIADPVARSQVVEVPPSFRLIDGGGNRGWIARNVPAPLAPRCM